MTTDTTEASTAPIGDLEAAVADELIELGGMHTSQGREALVHARELDTMTQADRDMGRAKASRRCLEERLMGLGMSLIPPGPAPAALGDAMRRRMTVLDTATRGPGRVR